MKLVLAAVAVFGVVTGASGIRAGFHRRHPAQRDADHPGYRRRRTPTGSISGRRAAARQLNGLQQLTTDTLWFINPEGGKDAWQNALATRTADLQRRFHRR